VVTNALALPRPVSLPTLAESLHDLPFGSYAQIQTAEGRIAAFLAYVKRDRRLGTVQYALRILNNTPFEAHARLSVESRGQRISAYPLTLRVAPYSLRDDLIPVRVDVTGPFDRAIVEVVSETSEFTVDAAAPPEERPRWLRWTAIPAAAALVATCAAFSAPRVVALDVPPRAVGGTSVHVPYQVSGFGRVEYQFMTRDGVQLAAGLGSSAGVLILPIPSDAAGGPYVLHLWMRNALASSEQSATIKTTAHAEPAQHMTTPAQLPLISDLSVKPSIARAGSDVDVRYVTQAVKGDLFLVDASGRTWSRATLSPAGSSMLTIPQSAAGSDMRVVLYARRGTMHAQNAVNLSVLPDSRIAPGVSSAAHVAVSRPAPTAAPQASPVVSLDSQVVEAGETVVVRISGTHPDARIALMSTSGTTVAQGEIPDDGNAISIAAPEVNTVTPFYVSVAFTNGVSQQTVLRRLTVTPH
jgi:hypothetical protein